MALSMLKVIDTEVTWVCDHSAVSLLQCIPQIKEIIPINHGKILRGNFLQKAKEVFLLWRHLLFKSYSQIILGHKDPRYRLLVFGRRVDHSLADPFHIFSDHYMAFEYLRLIQGDLKEKEELSFPQMELPSSFVEQRYDLIMAPGGNMATEPGKYLRSWPLKNYGLLATKLISEKKKVAIVGSLSDKYIEEHFPKEVDSYVGKFDLGQLLDFYQKGTLLLTHDSGPMHLGFLAGIKILALFGPTTPRTFAPPNAHYLWGGEKLPCRPCYDGKCYAKCNRPLCMEEIEIDQVYEKIMSLL